MRDEEITTGQKVRVNFVSECGNHRVSYVGKVTATKGKRSSRMWKVEDAEHSHHWWSAIYLEDPDTPMVSNNPLLDWLQA